MHLVQHLRASALSTAVECARTCVELVGIDGAGAVTVKLFKDAPPLEDVLPEGAKLLYVYLPTLVTIKQSCTYKGSPLVTLNSYKDTIYRYKAALWPHSTVLHIQAVLWSQSTDLQIQGSPLGTLKNSVHTPDVHRCR